MSNPKLQKIIKLTQTQYDILSNGGTVGGYTGLNDNYLYLIQDDTNYQPLDGDLTAIAALSGTGYLKRTGNNVWTLDNSTFATQTWVTNQGYITGITSAMVTTALGYTPYNSSNPAGYITTAALSGYATQQWVTNQGYLTSVSWNDVQNKPNFATVATSGSYNDLSNKPNIPTHASDVNDYGSVYVNPSQVRQYQITFGIAPTLLTNINGHSLSSVYNTVEVTVDGHPAVKIRKNDGNANLTFDESHNYMRKITGSEFTPTFGNGTVPQYSYIVDGNGMIYKPQWDQNNGLLLYKVNRLAMYSDIPAVLSTGATNKDKYLHTNATTGDLEWTTVSSGGGGTVTSVSAGTGLSISGTSTVNPTVNIATGYSLMSTGTQSFAGSKTFNGPVYFGDTVTLQNNPLTINSDNYTTYTGNDWDASFYADKIEITNADTDETWTLRFPELANGETKTLATTDDIPAKAKVWTNSNPTSDFAAQTITVSSLANYSYIVVLFKLAKTNDNYLYFKMPRITNYSGPFGMTDGVNTYFRNMKVVSNTRLQFLAATYNGSTANNAMIPIEIWGTNSL